MIIRTELKSHAKDELRGRWGLAVGGFFLATFVTLISNLVLRLIQFLAKASESAALNTLIAIVVFVSSLIITSAIQVGTSKFALNYAINGETPKLENIFAGFKVLLKALGINILMIISIFVGFILLIVPGVILSFMFSQAFFILADDNSKSVIDCLKESAAMMKGYKFDFFVLRLSFIGWGILGMLSLFIGYLWLIPYISVTNASFYLTIKNNYSGGTEKTIPEF